MKRKQIEVKLITLFQTLDIDIDPKEYDVNVKSLGVDSLDFVDLVMKVEMVFKLTITDEMAIRLTTFNEWLDFIDERCTRSVAAA